MSKWTEEDLEILKSMYYNEEKLSIIAKRLKRSLGSIKNKVITLGLDKNHIRNHSTKFKAIYQEYDWCYKKYIIEGKTMQEMADEAGCTLRVLKKWCSEIHGLNQRTFKRLATLTDIQKQIIMSGRLEDGHITTSEERPVYIESHAENQKDYMFWKYNKLKNLCNVEPRYSPPSIRKFVDKLYQCQGTYRMSTRAIMALKPIRELSTLNLIKNLNWLGLILYILDDASRNESNWNLCVANLSSEEREYFIKICQEKFDLNCHLCSDSRYILFNSASSKRIDDKILELLPNDLDIVTNKVIKNRKNNAAERNLI